MQFVLAIFLVLGSQQDQLEIHADYQRQDDNIRYARGHVVATYQDMRIEADEVTYNSDTQIVEADGHIIYAHEHEHLLGDHASVHVDTKEGDFTNVSGELGPGFFIKAAQAHRTEEGIFRLQKATFTSCCNEKRQGWRLNAAKAVVNPHQTITSDGSIFHLENIPILYMPYVKMPASDRERATGFLIPSTSTSTLMGRAVHEGFYWAINRSADMTITGEYFTARGPAAGMVFRAAPEKNSAIRIETFIAHDKLGDGGESGRVLAFGEIGNGYRAATDMNLVSSLVFRQVYEDGLNLISSPLTNSVAFVTKNTPDLSSNLLFLRDGVFYTNQPTVVLQKAPSLEFGVPDHRLGSMPLYFDADSSFTSLARRDANINTGYVGRLDLEPSFELPVVRSSLLDWSNRVGFQETAYGRSLTSETTLGSGFNRLSFDYNSHLVGPQLERDFGSWRHVFEPTVDYNYVSGADTFRNTILVDNVDLVTHDNEVQYGFVNRIFTKREIFSWQVAQKYFFDPTFGGAVITGQRNVFAPTLDLTGFAFLDSPRRFSPIVSTMRLATTPNTAEDIEVDYDTKYHMVRDIGVIGNANRGLITGGLSYFYTHASPIEVPNNEIRASLAYGNRLKQGFSGAVSFSYDVLHSLFQGSTAEVGYNTNCYGFNLEVSQFNIGARVESRFLFSFTLKDVGSFGTIRPGERLF